MKIFVKTIILMVSLFILLGATDVTIEDIENELDALPKTTYESFQCDIQIQLDGKVIGESKLYRQGSKERIEIMPSVKSEFSQELTIIKDSVNTYTKTEEGWVKGENSMNSINNITSMEKNWASVLKKKDAEVEEVKNRKAIVRFKETENVMGIGKGRVGIDLDNGNILFYELETPMGSSKMIFEYDTKKGLSYLKGIKVTSNYKDMQGLMDIEFNNVRINEDMKSNLFKINEDDLIKWGVLWENLF